VYCRRIRFIGVASLITIAAGITITAGCSRQNALPVERLAVLPLENLSSDTQLNWFSRASAAVVQYDLAGSKGVFAKIVESLTGAQSMQASRMLEGYFYTRDGRIEIRVTIEDLRKTKAVKNFEIGGAAANGLVPLANELARRLSSESRAFSTSNENAFRLYGEALGSSDAAALERGLEAAMAADPGFAVGYLDQARLLIETGARDRAVQVIQASEQQRLDAVDRADAEFVASVASANVRARIRALNAKVRVSPANAGLFADLGQTQMAARDFGGAVRSYQQATKLNPEDPRAWNELGYALAWTRDLNAARAAIGQYQKLSPDEANPLDSLGEVSFFLGDFAGAERYFEQAALRAPAELLKAAEARLMSGDRQGADALFGKFLPSLPKDRAASVTEQWELLTRRRVQVEPAVGGPIGLLMAGKFKEALPGLQAAYDASTPSNDGQIRVLLAWARVETGGFEEAAKLLELCPLPLSGDPKLAPLVFPRYFGLRAAVLEKQGKTDEASKNRELYQKLGGATK
jgi:Flp pilus assembly protein TadD